MAIDFPNSPSVNDTYTSGGATWQWDGTAWNRILVFDISLSGDVTGTGNNSNIPTILANTPVASGNYGNNTAVATFTVDSKGRLTAASNTAIRGSSTSQTGIVQLSNSVSSTSETLAATASAVKSTYDQATSYYRLGGILNLSGNGNFIKADYPNLKAISIRAIGGGGGGGGAATTGASTVSAGDGGGGGAYVEKFIPASLLGANIAYSVGSGGAGGTSAGAGTAGGATTFSSSAAAPAVNYAYVSAGGGSGGTGGGASGVAFGRDDVAGGTASISRDFDDAVGQALAGVTWITTSGSPGEGGIHYSSNRATGGAGGGSVLSGPTTAVNSGTTFSNGSNATGRIGSGGGGATNGNNNASNRPGGNGAGGMLQVHLFY